MKKNKNDRGRYSIIVICFIYTSTLHGQKPALSLSVLNQDNWSAIEPNYKISNDGKYVSYSISNKPVSSSTLVVQSTEKNWKKELVGVGAVNFTEDSRLGIYKKGIDSLMLLGLGTSHVECIAPVSSYNLVKQGNTEKIVYTSLAAKRCLILYDPKSEKQQVIDEVDDYIFSANNMVLFTQFKQALPEGDITTIKRIDFSETFSVQKTIYSGGAVRQMATDKEGKNLVFIEQDNLWSYTNGKDFAERMKELPHRTKTVINIEMIEAVSLDGDRFFVSYKEKGTDSVVRDPDAVQVDVWSYTDAVFPAAQIIQAQKKEEWYENRIIAVVDISSEKYFVIKNADEEMNIIYNGKCDDWILNTQVKGGLEECYWNRQSVPTYFLVSTITGERKELPYRFIFITAKNNYLVAEDVANDVFYSYDIKTGIIRNISKDIPHMSPAEIELKTGMSSDSNDGLIYDGSFVYQGEEYLFISDGFDYWQVDLSGQSKPVNLTKGYGRQHNIRFNMLFNHDGTFDKGDKIILDAFDENSNDNGFFQFSIGVDANPEKLMMGPYLFAGGKYAPISGGGRPIKAVNAESYLVSRTTVSQSRNLFWTRDFKKLNPLSNNYPEKDYNWITSELVHFKAMDGSTKKGALYRPENFDPTKKYPVIVYYYELKSACVNSYFAPKFSDGDINIPYFVSNGYLVFMPDMYYRVGEIGESALSSIVGAYNYLALQPFVNPSKVGLSGHSFGGFETYYTITHSNLFAAACSDAGPTNIVSQSGFYELSTGSSLQSLAERGQARMGATLWERPERYLSNSSVLMAHRVSTPVLMVSNKKDAIVHFEQGVQFFTALRRLGRKAWMLQYDGEDHSVAQPKNKRDLTIRMTQFFDHYLKGAPAPKWMLDGIPAKLKGIDPGYELDTTGRTPGPGLLTNDEQKKVDVKSWNKLSEK